MNGGALKRAKREVRRRVLAARDAIAPPELALTAERVARRVVDLPELADARTVLAFWSFGSEVPTAPLLEALTGAGHRVLLPRIAGDELELRTWSPGDPLSATSFGAMEPTDGAVVDAGEVDVVVTPAVAFDRMGGRVGYGRGFYDRLFRRTRPGAFRLGIATDEQLVDGRLPAGPFDLPVHAIVTGSGVVRPGTAGPAADRKG
jgi:5-formyltetrahydrofolate cyclo-ligase